MTTYGSLAGVQAIIPSFRFSETSTPMIAQVETWLGEGSAEIDRMIAGAGYVVPVDGEAQVYASVVALDNLYGAAYVLRSQNIQPTTGQGQSSSESYLRDFYRRLENMVNSDMVLLGVPLLPTPSASSTYRRVRSLQLRRIDGYSEVTD